MKNLLLFLTIGILSVGCDNYADDVEVIDRSTIVESFENTNWMAELTQIDIKASASQFSSAAEPMPVPGLVTLGPKFSNGDYSLIFSQHIIDMTITAVLVDETVWVGTGYDSQNVIVVNGSHLVQAVYFKGYNSGGEFVSGDVQVLEALLAEQEVEVQEELNVLRRGVDPESAIRTSDQFITSIIVNPSADSWYVEDAAGNIIQINKLICEDSDFFVMSVTGAPQSGVADLGFQNGAWGQIFWDDTVRCAGGYFVSDGDGTAGLQSRIQAYIQYSDAVNYKLGFTPESAITTSEDFLSAISSDDVTSLYVEDTSTDDIIQINKICEDNEDFVFSVAGTEQNGFTDTGIKNGRLGYIHWDGGVRCVDGYVIFEAEGTEGLQSRIQTYIQNLNATNFRLTVAPEPVAPEPVAPTLSRDGSTIENAITTNEDFLIAIDLPDANSWYVEDTTTGNILQFNRFPCSNGTFVMYVTGAEDDGDTTIQDGRWVEINRTGESRCDIRRVELEYPGTAGLQFRISAFVASTDATNFRPGFTVESAITTNEDFLIAIDLPSANSWYVEDTTTGNILQFNRFPCSNGTFVMYVTGAEDDGDTTIQDGRWAEINQTGGNRCDIRRVELEYLGTAGLQFRISAFVARTDATNFRPGFAVESAITTSEDFLTAIEAGATSLYVEDTSTGDIIQVNRGCDYNNSVTLSVTGASAGGDTVVSNGVWGGIVWDNLHGGRCAAGVIDLYSAGTIGMQERIQLYIVLTDATNFR
ncbi:hypothetical protein [Pelagibaculum spongiae]|uniref:Uncharacterized protein n=1 Tax=Pelagibaculum spongiae TaxID=2080658 RepID=A0A2V1GVU4_9GAMM|nr:hypothetical protein [Pelagibaculum spongiae]PVZ68767.1 hypothetical protein DC094_10945 [Pelagibaculum spongiae]